MKRRTKQQIAADLAQKLNKPVIFYTCGDQNNYAWHGIIYPSGKITWHVAGACTFYRSKLGAKKREELKQKIGESNSIIERAKKELKAIDYKDAKIKKRENE